MRVQQGLGYCWFEVINEVCFPGSVDSIQQNIRESSTREAKTDGQDGILSYVPPVIEYAREGGER